MNFIQSLFSDDKGNASMTRLLMFMSFFPASWFLIENDNPESLLWFTSAYAASYIGGKLADKWGEKRGITMINKTDSGDINPAQGNS